MTQIPAEHTAVARNHLHEVQVEVTRILNSMPESAALVILLDEELFAQTVRLFVTAGAPDTDYEDISLILPDGRTAMFAKVDAAD